MATRTLSFQYVLKQNKNDDSTAFGKWFAEAYNLKNPLSLKGLCNRVAMDQAVFTEEQARGVIDRLTVTMAELLQSGTSVKWDSLGTFRPTVESTGANDPEDYDINTMVNGIHIRFVPMNDKGEELTSRKFAESLTFSYYGDKTTQKKQTATGKTRYSGFIQTAKSISLKSKYPIFVSIDSASTGDIKTTGSQIVVSGSKQGIAYTLYRGATLEAATAISAAVTSLYDGSSLNFTTNASEADATSKKVWVKWSYNGNHSVFLGSFKVVTP